jgi:NADPH:quinone reductase
MKRILIDPSVPGALALGESPRPEPLPHQAVVKVRAFSLNRGEITMAQHSQKGGAIGWDYAGTIERTGSQWQGPAPGTRVVGWRPEMDAFAEQVLGEANYLAPIPDTVSDTQAATLPVAGLTALAALDRGTRLVGNGVLVTGVTGGVGHFALQLAKLAGARVIAQVRRAEQADFARGMGADAVVVTEDGAGLEREGPYRLVIDGVGGPMFGRLVEHTAKGGTVVSYGGSGGYESLVPLYPSLFGRGGQRTIYGLTLYTEAELEASSLGLARLLRLVEDGRLRVPEIVSGGWSDTPRLAQELLARKFSGKAVVQLSA